MNHRVLIIDDDPEVGRVLGEIFSLDFPCLSRHALSGREGLNLIQEFNPSLIVLDLTLPDISGIDVCRAIRSQGLVLPILLLSARNEEVDKILGLESGADDYVVKPFSPREFVARMKSILRRIDRANSPDSLPAPTTLEYGDLSIEFHGRLVTLRGRPLEVSRTEFELLWLMASHPGKTFTREQLIECILGYEAGNYDHALTSHISRLRMKLEVEPSRPQFIQTVRGHGYRFGTREELQA